MHFIRVRKCLSVKCIKVIISLVIYVIIRGFYEKFYIWASSATRQHNPLRRPVWQSSSTLIVLLDFVHSFFWALPLDLPMTWYIRLFHLVLLDFRQVLLHRTEQCFFRGCFSSLSSLLIGFWNRYSVNAERIKYINNKINEKITIT